jgi:hypothetical protein
MASTRKIVALAVLAVALGGCSYATMRQPQTGAKVDCGRFPIAPWLSYARAKAQVFDEVRCIEDLKAQGYLETAELRPAAP